MNILRFLFLLSVFYVWGPEKAETQDLNTIFARANQAGSTGEHENAVTLYQQLIEAGVHDADVEFNLGTIYAKMHRYGSAIVHF